MGGPHYRRSWFGGVRIIGVVGWAGPQIAELSPKPRARVSGGFRGIRGPITHHRTRTNASGARTFLRHTINYEHHTYTKLFCSRYNPTDTIYSTFPSAPAPFSNYSNHKWPHEDDLPGPPEDVGDLLNQTSVSLLRPKPKSISIGSRRNGGLNRVRGKSTSYKQCFEVATSSSKAAPAPGKAFLSNP
jgi:hypothetical protein